MLGQGGLRFPFHLGYVRARSELSDRARRQPTGGTAVPATTLRPCDIRLAGLLATSVAWLTLACGGGARAHGTHHRLPGNLHRHDRRISGSGWIYRQCRWRPRRGDRRRGDPAQVGSSSGKSHRRALRDRWQLCRRRGQPAHALGDRRSNGEGHLCDHLHRHAGKRRRHYNHHRLDPRPRWLHPDARRRSGPDHRSLGDVYLRGSFDRRP